MTREEKIKELIKTDLSINDFLFEEILKEGFVGYNNMSDEEIDRLYEQN